MRGHALASTDITQFYVRKASPSKVEKKKKPKKITHDKREKARRLSKMSAESLRLQRQPQPPKTELDFEIERLKAEIQQERQMKDMLEESSQELEKTITQMQEKFDTVDEEDNEWKTRFETQQQMNNQLEKQILLLRDKLEQMKIPSRDGKPKHFKTYNGLSDAEVRKLMRQMERDKAALEGQLKDLEWRLDNESKAFHKIDDEKQKYLTELHEANKVINDTKTTRRQALNDAQRQSDAQMSRISHNALQKGSNIFGLPDNQRIIDPKKGPVKKTAAVRKLPKIDNTNLSPR